MVFMGIKGKDGVSVLTNTSAYEPYCAVELLLLLLNNVTNFKTFYSQITFCRFNSLRMVVVQGNIYISQNKGHNLHDHIYNEIFLPYITK